MFKKRTLPIDKMISLEQWVEDNIFNKFGYDFTETELSSKLGLKVEYIESNEMPDNTEALLCPSQQDDEYNGIIKINSAYKNSKFAYMHEIIHYLYDVGLNNSVSSTFARKTKGNTKDVAEQEINYRTASATMPYKIIKAQIKEYDTSSPKIDEIAFVNNLCVKYDQTQDAVIRRIREVRMIYKHRTGKSNMKG